MSISRRSQQVEFSKTTYCNLDRHSVEPTCQFQQDSQIPYFSNLTIELLERKTNGCVILRNGDVNCSAR